MFSPFFNLAAASVGGQQYIWGAAVGIGQAYTGVVTQFTYSGGTWSGTTVSAPDMAVNVGTTSFTWHDRTSGVNGNGVDAALFYVANGKVYEMLPNFGTAVIATNAATNDRAQNAARRPAAAMAPTSSSARLS